MLGLQLRIREVFAVTDGENGWSSLLRRCYARGLRGYALWFIGDDICLVSQRRLPERLAWRQELSNLDSECSFAASYAYCELHTGRSRRLYMRQRETLSDEARLIVVLDLRYSCVATLVFIGHQAHSSVCRRS